MEKLQKGEINTNFKQPHIKINFHVIQKDGKSNEIKKVKSMYVHLTY